MEEMKRKFAWAVFRLELFSLFAFSGEVEAQGLGSIVGTVVDPSGAVIAGAKVTATEKDWLNPASFAPNPSNTFGNVGKGSVRFPGFYAWDMGLSKNFSFTERWRLQYRAEFFNIFNRVNFLGDEGTVNNFSRFSSTKLFGALQQGGAPRIGQMALKLFF